MHELAATYNLAVLAFDAHVARLREFLGRREEIVERIQRVLNAQRKPVEYLQNSAVLGHDFDECFSKTGPKGELEEAHWADGFRPRDLAGLHNGPADPAELMTRAFYLWSRTRWPGRAGRLRYAH